MIAPVETTVPKLLLTPMRSSGFAADLPKNAVVR